MNQALEAGIYLGLSLAVLIGPVFFSLLQVSASRGFLAGFFMAIGISISDGLYIFISNLFVRLLSSSDKIQFFLGVFGGFILIIVGIMTILRKPVLKASGEAGSSSGLKNIGLIGRGFILNFAHPGVLIFWLGVSTLLEAEWGFTTTNEKVTLFSATIVTVFTTDLLKAYLANLIKKLLTLNILLWINRIMGIALVGFGIHLLVSTFFK